MDPRVRLTLLNAFTHTCIISTPAIFWTCDRSMLRGEGEMLITWAQRSGALLMSGGDAERWWRLFTAPLLHEGTHHLMSNIVMIAVSAMVISLISLNMSPLLDARHKVYRWSSRANLKRCYHVLMWLYLTSYVGAGLTGASRLMIGQQFGVTHDSIGLSGGAFLALSAVCVRAGSDPSSLGLSLQGGQHSRHFTLSLSLVWLSVPLVLLMLNRGPHVDEWSHVTGWILGTTWGVIGSLWRLSGRRCVRCTLIGSLALALLVTWQIVAMYLCTISGS